MKKRLIRERRGRPPLCDFIRPDQDLLRDVPLALIQNCNHDRAEYFCGIRATKLSPDASNNILIRAHFLDGPRFILS